MCVYARVTKTQMRTLNVNLYDDIIAIVTVGSFTLVVSLVRLFHVLNQQFRVAVVGLISAARQASVDL